MQRMRDGTYVVNYQVAEAPVAVPRMVGVGAANDDRGTGLIPFAPAHLQQQNRRGIAAPLSSSSSAAAAGFAGMGDMDVTMDDLGMDPAGSFPSQSGPPAYPLAARSAAALGSDLVSPGGGPSSTSSAAATNAANNAAATGGPTGGGVEGQSTTLTGHFAMDVTDLWGV
ncbi:hypothetical protein BCR44DRAFT_1528574, partial [Catenaria anguillulae PL171]